MRAAVVVIGILSCSVAHAGRGGGIIVPPAEVDIGVMTPIGGGDAVGTATDVLVGVHWGSVAWRPTAIEVGVGYVGSFRPLLASRGPAAARSRDVPRDDEELSMHGGYLTLGRTVTSDRHFRTWIEARGELLRARLGDRSFSAIGGALRISAELYATGALFHHQRNTMALAAGTVALGVYFEASHRDISVELGPTGVAGGITIRVPFLLAGAG